MLRSKIATKTTMSRLMDANDRANKSAVNLSLSFLLLAATILFVQTNNISTPVIPITIPNQLLNFNPSVLLSVKTKPTHTATNTTIVSKINTQEKTVTVHSGENLSIIFHANKISAHDLQEIMQLGKPVAALKHLKPGQTLVFTLDETRQLQQLSLELTATHFLTITRDGKFFKATTTTEMNKPAPTVVVPNKKEEVEKTNVNKNTDLQFTSATVKHSLTAAALQAGLSHKSATQLNNIFSSKISVHPGDTIKVLSQTLVKNGRKTTDIIAAEIMHKGQAYKAMRFTDAEGHTGYYTPEGKSLSKMAFTRYPVHFSRISSPFSNMRWHPLLHMYRKHSGVDYAAPYGTPIKAAGDGVITFVGKENGYGKAVIVRHNHTITTLYGHMSRYAKGMTNGKAVKLGQIIGYVGSSGLASGPHLHFEYRINNVAMDPLKVVLPDAPPLAAKYMHDFIAQTRTALAILNSHTQQLAMK